MAPWDLCPYYYEISCLWKWTSCPKNMGLVFIFVGLIIHGTVGLVCRYHCGTICPWFCMIFVHTIVGLIVHGTVGLGVKVLWD